jgi:ATP-dependent Clp protease ATP-binding subunit ClpA
MPATKEKTSASKTSNNPASSSLKSINEFFSNSMRRILIYSNEEAKKTHAEDIDTEHLLMGILRNSEKDAVLNQIFARLKIDVPALMEETKKEIREGKNKNPAEFLPFSVRTKNHSFNRM